MSALNKQKMEKSSLRRNGKEKIRGKDLRKILNNRASSITINLLAKYYKHETKVNKFKLIQAIVETPEQFFDDKNWSVLAKALMPEVEKTILPEQEISRTPAAFHLSGSKQPVTLRMKALVFELCKEFEKARKMLNASLACSYDADFISFL